MLGQVEHALVRKQSFKLGIRKATPLKSSKPDGPELVKQAYQLLGCSDPTVYFPPKSALTARFDSDSKCFGKVKFVPCRIFTDGRLCLNENPELLQALRKLDTDFPDQLKRELVAGRYTNGGSVTFVMDMAGVNYYRDCALCLRTVCCYPGARALRCKCAAGMMDSLLPVVFKSP